MTTGDFICFSYSIIYGLSISIDTLSLVSKSSSIFGYMSILLLSDGYLNSFNLALFPWFSLSKRLWLSCMREFLTSDSYFFSGSGSSYFSSTWFGMDILSASLLWDIMFELYKDEVSYWKDDDVDIWPDIFIRLLYISYLMKSLKLEESSEELDELSNSRPSFLPCII